MKLTNKANLPVPIMEALKPWERNIRKHVYSVTELTSPPKQVMLKRRYYEEIEVDGSTRIWALFGTAVHHIIEKADNEDWFKEEFLSIEFEGSEIRGVFDMYNMATGELLDLKVVSVWSHIYGGNEWWETQLNLYAYMLRKAGFKVTSIADILIMRDWQSSKAKFDPEYPQLQVAVVEQDLWSDEAVEEFLRKTLALLNAAEDLEDDNIPVCTPEERWNKGNKYAIKKNNNKRAVKVYDVYEDAVARVEVMRSNDPKNSYSIEERIGEDTRCLNYCDSCTYCNYYNELKRGEQNE